MSEHILVNGEWKKATKVQLDGIPVGFSLPFRGTQPPYGWLVEDGREVSRTTYAKLFSVIGTTYGEGDGETTFNLPNSIGKYTKFGIGEEVGTNVEAGLPNIEGSLHGILPSKSSYPAGTEVGSGALQGTLESGAFGFSGATFVGLYNTYLNASLSNPIYGKSDTVTPPSLVALPCIKAFDTIAQPVEVDLVAEIEALKQQIASMPVIPQGAAVVVESSWNASTGAWYRKYSDGWIEQGGEKATPSGSGGYDMTINLNTAFTSTNYTLICNAPNAGHNYSYEVGYVSKSKSSFSCYCKDCVKVVWVAYGK